MQIEQAVELASELSHVLLKSGDYKSRHHAYVLQESLLTEWGDLDYSDQLQSVTLLVDGMCVARKRTD